MIRRPPRVTRTDTLFPTRRSSDLRRALKRLLDSPAALAVAWFVVVALLASVGAWAFLQPPPPAGGEAVTIAVELIASPAEPPRSEEHTSELQSLMRISYAVFCLKKKKLHKYRVCKTSRITY